MEIYSKTPREKFLITLSFLLLLATVGYYFLYLPLWRELGEVKVSIDNTKSLLTEIEGLKIRASMVNEGTGERMSLEQELQLLTGLAEITPSLIIDLERSAKDSDIGLETYQNLGVETKGNFNIYSFQLDVLGEYDDILCFIREVDGLPWALDLVGVQVLFEEDEDTRAKLQWEKLYFPSVDD